MRLKFVSGCLTTVIFFLAVQTLVAQGPGLNKWDKEMEMFEKIDKMYPVGKTPIIFTGSSSIARWNNLGSYFPGKPVLNRGFGGSKTDEVIYYADKAILAYKPKQVVIYVGDNDISSGRTPDKVFSDLKELFTIIRMGAPKATITFISIKPSPSRWKYIPQIKAVNDSVKGYLATLPKADYVDVFTPMLNASGRPIPEYYVADSLHMTVAGYELWKGILKKYVK